MREQDNHTGTLTKRPEKPLSLQRRRLNLRIMESISPVVLNFLEGNADTIDEILNQLGGVPIEFPKELKEEARKELTGAREVIGLAEVMLEREAPEDRKEWRIKRRNGINTRDFASDRIGFSKIIEQKAIQDKPVEYKARARSISLMMVLRRGIVINREKLEDVLKEADLEGIDLSGRDPRLVDRIMELFPSENKKKDKIAVRKSSKFSDRETKASYKAQAGVGAKVYEYQLSKEGVEDKQQS